MPLAFLSKLERHDRAEVHGGHSCADLFLACRSFIFNKLIREMNVKVTVCVSNMTMKI